MGTLTIGFNHWFSSIYGVIEDIKNKYKDIKVVMASSNENHVCKEIVDKFIAEDCKLQNEEYIDWYLKLCKENDISILFVHKNSKLFAKYKSKFKQSGVTVIVENEDTFNIVEDKVNTYEKFFGKNLNWIVPYFFYGNAENKDEIINKVVKEHNLCLKKRCDEGGLSFRIIEKNKNMGISSLEKYRVNRITESEAIEIINSAEDRINELMFMEVLDEPEISVDCYQSKKGFIAISREKLNNSRTERIYFDSRLFNICSEIQYMFRFKYPFNVQFRQTKRDTNGKSKLRLLEINTRLSGGTYLETKTGFNLAHVLIEDLKSTCRYNYLDYVNFNDKLITFVERAEVLNNE